jgi:diguanylate cyclase (GGDEF)-like protein/PAS domain S-box-containing protein
MRVRQADPEPEGLRRRRTALEERAAHIALNSIGDGVGTTDLAGNITFLNAMAEELTGWTSGDAIGRPMSDVIHIVDAGTHETIPDLTDRAVDGDETVHLPPNSLLLARDGREIPVEDSTAPIHDDDGATTGAVIVFRDVSDARAVLEKVSHLAQHDELTGLPNRNVLNDRITQAIGAAPRHSGQLAVMYLDLDGFKGVNDSLGHPVGDLLLQSVAARLVDCVRASDTVSRAGGDEFVVLLAEAEQVADAAIIATRMLDAVAEVHIVAGHELRVTTSIGVAVFPGDGDDAETLIKNADLAMYRVKDQGRSAFQFFDPATAIMPAAHADGALLRAPEEHELRQPRGSSAVAGRARTTPIGGQRRPVKPPRIRRASASTASEI